MNYFLIGMPASGKTTVGKSLAEKLCLPHIDLDDEIVKTYGNIAEIFKIYGEEYFRKTEENVLKKTALFNNIVVSTGGGTPLRQENVFFMRSRGRIIYLTADINTLLNRIGGDSGRPLLAGNTENRLKNLLSVRAHVYEKAADIQVKTDGITPEEIADKIIELLGNNL